MVHEIMNVELSRETRLETEAQLNQNFNDFSSKLGVNFDKKTEGEAAENKPSFLSMENSDFSKITNLVNKVMKE